ncbi:MAG: NADH-quinone oxidoreductase subunit C [Acidobacteriota bacterium]|nr:NADH-quinone oxidoreductase subunit C [Acidobacteriota bacterium]
MTLDKLVADRPTRATLEVAARDLPEVARVLLDARYRLASVVASEHDDLDVVYLFVDGPPDQRVEIRVRLDAQRPEVPSLAALSFPAGRFEREMGDLFGVVALGHPQPRPLVTHQHWPADWHPMRRESARGPWNVDAAPFPFNSVEGEGVYEIPVGPVHAGIIEPGHFRFWVVGETIIKMKARLWFTHKGVEKLFEGRDVAAAIPLAERISGDSAVGHSLAFVLAAEDALHVTPGEDDVRARAILLELERLYNHVADIGALCNDTAFSLAHARAMTLRETLLRLNDRVTGHRLLRGSIALGATTLRDVPRRAELEAIAERVNDVVALASANSVVMDRFRGTGVLSTADALEVGVLGVVARASGIARDARAEHPFITTRAYSIVTEESGDVLARFRVREREIAVSLAVIDELLSGGGTALEQPHSAGGTGTGIVEGWRGAITHLVEFDAGERLARVKVVDPSFVTWPALAVALANTIVPDFPLVNKSFNLSYAGNDL